MSADAPDPLLTTAEAAHAARRSPAAVRKWAQRQLLQAADLDFRGRPLYRYSDVLAAERTARNRDRSGRSAEAVNAR